MGDGNQILNFESTPSVNPDDDPDAPGFDEIRDARQIRDTVIETQKTGAFLVGSALEVYVEAAKIVSTERLAGWGIEGAIKGVVAAGKLAEVSRGARAASKLATKNAEELRAAANALKAAKGGMSAKRAAKADDEIRLLQKAANEQDEMARQGTSMANRVDDYAPKVRAEAREAGCFVAGTPVWMGDGTSKVIEQVKVGDLVLSKNEKTGEVAAKKVTNVSVRADIWTRKLTFDNGAILETTDEHPLYVEGRGFVKAKQIGIGSCIVTRAGPSAKVVAVEADVRRATVYNFTVDEFHTYFVGDAALWVHNVDCSEFVRNLEVRRPVGSQDAGFRQYQITHAGESELRIGTGANEIWADGLRVNTNTNTVTALETKFVGDVNRSPFVPGSNCPDFIRADVLDDLNGEFTRYAGVINDPNNPVKELELITNNTNAASYFQGLMQQHNIPGRVIVRP